MKSRKKVALVTGGSRGIGLAVARRLVEDGFDLTLSARRVDVLSVVADELRSTGAKVIVAPADMAVEHDAVKLADSHMENFERLDLLVICAGVGMAGDLETFPIHQFDKQLSVNVRSPFSDCCPCCGRPLRWRRNVGRRSSHSPPSRAYRLSLTSRQTARVKPL